MSVNDLAIKEKKLETYNKKISSREAVKAIALFFIIVDHIGLFFFPTNLILRAIGRAGFPLLFFLIGRYSFNKNKYEIFAIALSIELISKTTNYSMHMSSLNILASFLIVSTIDDNLVHKILNTKHKSIFSIFIFFLYVISFKVSKIYYQNGALCNIFSLCGYLNRDKKAPIFKVIVVLSLVFYFKTQLEIFNFKNQEILLLSVATLLLGYLFVSYKDKKNLLCLKGRPYLKFMSSMVLNSQYLYFYHMVIFSLLTQ